MSKLTEELIEQVMSGEDPAELCEKISGWDPRWDINYPCARTVKLIGVGIDLPQQYPARKAKDEEDDSE